MLSVANKPFVLRVIMLSVIMLSVIMLSVIMLNIVAPWKHLSFKSFSRENVFFWAEVSPNVKLWPGIKVAGNTKGGSITVPLTSCLTDLDQSILPIKTKIVSCQTADSKPVKQVSISPTFYEQLLRQNPFAKNYKPNL
jgi:hypothetical protein